MMHLRIPNPEKNNSSLCIIPQYLFIRFYWRTGIYFESKNIQLLVLNNYFTLLKLHLEGISDIDSSIKYEN